MHEVLHFIIWTIKASLWNLCKNIIKEHTSWFSLSLSLSLSLIFHCIGLLVWIGTSATFSNVLEAGDFHSIGQEQEHLVSVLQVVVLFLVNSWWTLSRPSGLKPMLDYISDNFGSSGRIMIDHVTRNFKLVTITVQKKKSRYRYWYWTYSKTIHNQNQPF